MCLVLEHNASILQLHIFIIALFCPNRLLSDLCIAVEQIVDIQNLLSQFDKCKTNQSGKNYFLKVSYDIKKNYIKKISSVETCI